MPWLRFRFYSLFFLHRKINWKNIIIHHRYAVLRFSKIDSPDYCSRWSELKKLSWFFFSWFVPESRMKFIRPRKKNEVKENYGNFLLAFVRCCLLIFYAWHRMNDAFISHIKFSFHTKNPNGYAQKKEFVIRCRVEGKKSRRLSSSSLKQISDVLMARFRYWLELFLLFIGHCGDLS